MRKSTLLMLKKILIFLISLSLFLLIALILKSGDIKPKNKNYNERVSFEKNEFFNITGLLNTDSTNVCDSLFKDKFTLVQFSFNACGACRRDKQFFPKLLDNTPKELQIVTISIDSFDKWRTINKNTAGWIKLNLGQSNLKSELKITGYPTYFFIDKYGKIISRPSDGIAYLNKYYDFSTTTNFRFLKDYITYLRKTKRFWNHIFMFVCVYFFLVGSIFIIISLVITIRNRQLSLNVLSKIILFYLVSTFVFIGIVYFTDGREDIKRINTKDTTGLGEVFGSFSMVRQVKSNQKTLVHFFALHNIQSNRDLTQIPKLLETKKDIQILSICLNDSSIWNLAQTSDVYFPTGKESDSIKVDANFNSKRNDRWHIVHGEQDTSWVGLEIKSIPTYLILDSESKIIERPRRGIDYMRVIEYSEPSFAGLSKYIVENGGWGVFFLRGILVYILTIGIFRLFKYFGQKKVHRG